PALEPPLSLFLLSPLSLFLWPLSLLLPWSVEGAPSLAVAVAGLFEAELYRSEYQPPPLRMNPPPREICRRAVCSWQVGHSVSAAALIDCSASHSWWQEEQAYS